MVNQRPRRGNGEKEKPRETSKESPTGFSTFLFQMVDEWSVVKIMLPNVFLPWTTKHRHYG
jgi:hypothetical protein